MSVAAGLIIGPAFMLLRGGCVSHRVAARSGADEGRPGGRAMHLACFARWDVGDEARETILCSDCVSEGSVLGGDVVDCSLSLYPRGFCARPIRDGPAGQLVRSSLH